MRVETTLKLGFEQLRSRCRMSLFPAQTLFSTDRWTDESDSLHVSSPPCPLCSQTLCSAVVQVYAADRSCSWVKRCCGVACLVKDNPQRSYFIRVFDIKVSQTGPWKRCLCPRISSGVTRRPRLAPSTWTARPAPPPLSHHAPTSCSLSTGD